MVLPQSMEGWQIDFLDPNYVLGFRGEFYYGYSGVRFLSSGGAVDNLTVEPNSGLRIHINPDPSNLVHGLEAEFIEAVFAMPLILEPVEGTAHILSEGNLSIAGPNPTVRGTGMVISSSPSLIILNHDSYQVAKVLAVDNAKVTSGESSNSGQLG